MKAHNKDTQAQMTPDKSLATLKEGNHRFAQNQRLNRDLKQYVEDTKDGQWPFAVVLSCIDSRASAELIFDQGIGDIFSIRIAGNILNDDILGSMEFGCKVKHCKVLLVVGHTGCGAINGACNHIELGNLTGLLHKVQPAIDAVQSAGTDPKAPEFEQRVTEQNVMHVISSIRKSSDILRDMEAAGEIAIAGAMYSVETGEVAFLEEKVATA